MKIKVFFLEKIKRTGKIVEFFLEQRKGKGQCRKEYRLGHLPVLHTVPMKSTCSCHHITCRSDSTAACMEAISEVQ